jgi:hypothetical protein
VFAGAAPPEQDSPQYAALNNSAALQEVLDRFGHPRNKDEFVTFMAPYLPAIAPHEDNAVNTTAKIRSCTFSPPPSLTMRNTVSA